MDVSFPGNVEPGHGSEDGPSQAELAEGHLFTFVWNCKGVYSIADDPTYYESQLIGPSSTFSVRAFSIRQALEKALDLDFPELVQWDVHNYLSTACQHDEHDDCRKVCKFCDAKCLCHCHDGSEVR